MDTKARSKPMRNILSRLLSTGEFECIIFGDKVILDECIEDWPSCDFFISFFSSGFPLQKPNIKAMDYVKLRKPYCVNDLAMQQLLMDRRFVSDSGKPALLSQEVIQRAKSEYNVDLSPSGFTQSTVKQLENLDDIELDGELMSKPFVEKPLSGEDHNINIYFSSTSGGGARKLFRKIGNKSSDFDKSLNEIRKDSVYIYEEFVNVDMAEDVKVYTIGQNFAHAETRKSPVVDGVVRRNSDGKEVRYITKLTPEEVIIAKKVGKTFGQFVCGFDLLRANGKSYVIDVNGWSFVKGNELYYENSAQILRESFHQVIKKRGLRLKQDNSDNQWKLKSFLSVLRHGDRTPKLKRKYSFKDPVFLALLNGLTEEVVFKNGRVDIILAACNEAIESKTSDDIEKINQLILILDAKQRLNETKIQIKPVIVNCMLVKVQLIVKWGGEITHAGLFQSQDFALNLRNDLQLINSEILQNVRVYTSSERRVVATAEIFLGVFHSLAPDCVQIPITVSKEMLDDSFAAKPQMDGVKLKLYALLSERAGEEVVDTPQATQLYLTKEGSSQSLNSAVQARSKANPANLVDEIIAIMRIVRPFMKENYETAGGFLDKPTWCCPENPVMFKERWEKLFRDYCDVERTKFETSKVSELYDSLKYDLIHNRDFIIDVFSLTEEDNFLLTSLYNKAKLLFDVIAPKEYGIDPEEKLEIGMLNSSVLLNQLVSDLQEASQSTKPSSYFYFTKESKVICLYNIVMLCGLPTKLNVDIDELDYLSQITFELYERTRASSGVQEYSLRIGLSSGSHDPNLGDLHLDLNHSISVTPKRWISDHISLNDALSHLKPKGV